MGKLVKVNEYFPLPDIRHRFLYHTASSEYETDSYALRQEIGPSQAGTVTLPFIPRSPVPALSAQKAVVSIQHSDGIHSSEVSVMSVSRTIVGVEKDCRSY